MRNNENLGGFCCNCACNWAWLNGVMRSDVLDCNLCVCACVCRVCVLCADVHALLAAR